LLAAGYQTFLVHNKQTKRGEPQGPAANRFNSNYNMAADGNATDRRHQKNKKT
jgi:hypothetical protein